MACVVSKLKNNASLDCVFYGLVVVGINNIMCKYIVYVCARYVGTLSVEYYLVQYVRILMRCIFAHIC